MVEYNNVNVKLSGLQLLNKVKYAVKNQTWLLKYLKNDLPYELLLITRQDKKLS